MNSRYIQPSVIKEQDPVPGYLETAAEPKLVKFILDSDAKVGQHYTIKLGEKGTHEGSLTRKDLERGYVQVLVALPTDTYIDFNPPVILISCAGSTEDAAILIQDPTSLYSLGIDGTDVLTNVSITSIMDYINSLGITAEISKVCTPNIINVTDEYVEGSYTISYIINNGNIVRNNYTGTSGTFHDTYAYLIDSGITFNGRDVFGTVESGGGGIAYLGLNMNNNTVSGFSSESTWGFIDEPITITFVASDNPDGGQDGAVAYNLLGKTFHSCGYVNIPGV